MSFIDIVLLIIIFGFVWIGFWSGFIHTLGSFLGVFVATAIAFRYFLVIAPAWEWVFFGHRTLAKIVVFIVLFVLVNRLVGLMFWLAGKLFHIVKFFPFLSTFNRLLGATLGLFEGMLAAGVVLFLMTKLPISKSLSQAIASSPVAQTLLTMITIVKPFIPEFIKGLKTLV